MKLVRSLVLLFAAGLVLAPAAGAAVLDVCQAGGATYTSIQDAVDDAVDGDVIDICAGVHTEAGITASGLALTFQGQGQGATIVQAAADAVSATDLVFGVEVSAGETVTFRDMTIRHGRQEPAGGISVSGEDPLGSIVVVERCTVTANFSPSEGTSGGGITAFQASLSLSDSLVSDNQGDVFGGVFVYVGVLTMERTTITANAGIVGGVFVVGAAKIVSSTISANVGSELAGLGAQGELFLVNSTVSGNTADVGASGVIVFAFPFVGLFPNAILNSTIAANNGAAPGFYLVDGATLAIGNTIIAENTGGDCFLEGSAAIYAIGPNLDSDGTCTGFSLPSADADLQPLADNGGPTQTHAITDQGDAFDAGDDALCAEPDAMLMGVDQRGVARPQFAHCDLGAFETDELSNQPPDCSGAFATPDLFLVATNQFKTITIEGVIDPDGDPVSLVVDAIFQDEPVTVPATCPDALGVGTSSPQVRAERAYNGDGRMYHIFFTASSEGGTCNGEVTVGVAHKGKGYLLVDGGALFDSTACP